MLRTGDIGLSLRSGLSRGLFGFFGLVASSSRRITFRRSSSAAASKLMTGRILNDYVRLDLANLERHVGCLVGRGGCQLMEHSESHAYCTKPVQCPRSVYTFSLRRPWAISGRRRQKATTKCSGKQPRRLRLGCVKVSQCSLVWGHNGRCTAGQANEEAQRSKASEWLSISVYV